MPTNRYNSVEEERAYRVVDMSKLRGGKAGCGADSGGRARTGFTGKGRGRKNVATSPGSAPTEK